MRITLEEEEIKPIAEIESIPKPSADYIGDETRARARRARKKPRRRRKVRVGKEDLLLVIVIPSILFLIFYGVFTAELAIKDALTFLTGLIGGTWVGASAGLSGKRG